MFFRSLSLTQFRNYNFRRFSFAERIVCITGLNGSGKTNLLDALYYLCFTRSYFLRPDAQSVQHAMRGFRLQGDVERGGRALEAVCILRENNKKEFSVDGSNYQRFSQHIGRFPCVMIAPDDVELITGGSELRRREIDTLLSQLVPDYLSALGDYNKLLQQRNSLLKASAEAPLDETLLDILDAQLAEKGQFLFAERRAFLEKWIPTVVEQYTAIAGNSDGIALAYESQLHRQPLADLLRQGRAKDLLLQRTGAGIHKDDLVLEMTGLPFKNLASQGQRKSLLFALKLAAYHTLHNYLDIPPVLLLDDVFEKLDARRMEHLLHTVCVEGQGQVFITDTHPDRIETALAGLDCTYQLIPLT
jgi:DNA replication and repair protein RecF